MFIAVLPEQHCRLDVPEEIPDKTLGSGLPRTQVASWGREERGQGAVVVNMAYLRLGQTDVLLLKEKLPVEVTDIDGVQVDLEGGGTKGASTHSWA